MDIIHFVITTVLIGPVFGGLFGYHTIPPTTPINYFLNGAYNGFRLLGGSPYQPFFSYSLNTPPYVNPYVPPQVPAVTFDKPIYSSPTDTYRGFSYITKYNDGGSSKVVFVTGPESQKLMKQSTEFFQTFFPKDNKQPNETSTEASPTESTSQTPSPPSTKSTEGESPAFTAPQLPSDPTHSFTSVYHVQLFPAHTAPLLGVPIPLHRILSSYYHTIGQPATNNTGDNQETNRPQEHADEAQESMINEVGARANANIPLHSKAETDKETKSESGAESATNSDQNPNTTSKIVESVTMEASTELQQQSTGNEGTTENMESTTKSENHVSTSEMTTIASAVTTAEASSTATAEEMTTEHSGESTTVSGTEVGNPTNTSPTVTEESSTPSLQETTVNK